jgi:hypothetical protein
MQPMHHDTGTKKLHFNQATQEGWGQFMVPT